MSRQEQLSNLQNYLKEVDKDITMILQNLQWDRSLLSTEQFPLSKCKYNENHKVSNSKLREHEEMCFLKQNGYSPEEVFLPELLDTDGPTVVTFNSLAIKEIKDNAAKQDPLFKRGCNSEDILPLSAERLQSTYTADERRAIHDAVVSSVRMQSEHVDEFVMPSNSSGAVDGDKSWLERLAEKRDGRRRRAKYRAPPKTRNYSLVLRDVISTQMELLSELSGNSEVDQSHTQGENGDDIKKEIEVTSHDTHESTLNSYTKSDLKSAHKSNSERYSHESDRRHYRLTENAASRKYKNKHYKDNYDDDTESVRYYEHKQNEDKYSEDAEGRRYYDKHSKDKYSEDTEGRKYYGKHSKDKYNDGTESKRYYDKHTNDKYSEDTEGRRYYDKHSKNKYNDDTESTRYYDNNKEHAPINYNKMEDKEREGYTNEGDVRSYYRHRENTSRRERERSTQESSKDKSKYKQHRDDKMYQRNDEYTKSDKRKRSYDDEKYEGYTERRSYKSSERKRGKYDERQEREKERSYGKHKSDDKHKKGH